MADQGMTLRDHLDELRKRLVISVAFVVLMAFVAFGFREPILTFLLEPGFGSRDMTPIATEVLETVSVVFKITIMVGFAGALPMILYQLIMFVSPGLTRRERAYLFLFLPGVLLTFAAGVAFGYFVLFPPVFQFLFTFGDEFVDSQIRIASYMNVVTSLMFWMGIVFQIPVVTFGLARFGVLTHQRLSSFRRISIVLAFVAAAIIMPTIDPVNQTLVAVPILILYELGILTARLGVHLRNSEREDVVRPPGRIARAKARVRSWCAGIKARVGRMKDRLKRWARKLLFWKRGD